MTSATTTDRLGGARYWDSEIETLPRARLAELQASRLVEQVQYVYQRSPFYHELFDAAAVKPSDINDLSDLTRIPLITKDHLRAWRARTGDPFCGSLCVDQCSLVYVNKSTGTTGFPNLFALDGADVDTIADTFARCLYSIGMRPGFHVVYPGQLRWHGNLAGLAEGLGRLGCVRYPLFDSLEGLMDTLFDLLCGAPLNATVITTPERELPYLEARGIRPKEVFPELEFTFAGFMFSDARREKVDRSWGVPYRNFYASGDQYLMASECMHSPPKHHLPEDRVIFEVINPDTGETLGPGDVGELVITNLWGRATPLIRYRMEDIVSYHPEPCSCGRTHARLHVYGRFASSVNVSGRYVFAEQLEDVLWRYEPTSGTVYQLVRTLPKEAKHSVAQETLVVRTALCDDFSDDPEIVAELETRLTDHFGVPSEVEIIRPDEVRFGVTKFERVIHR